MGLFASWQADQAPAAAPTGGGLFSRWQADQAAPSGGIGIQPAPTGGGGMFASWQQKQKPASAPHLLTAPELPEDYIDPNYSRVLPRPENERKLATAHALPPAPTGQPSPASGAFWQNYKPPAAPNSHLLELMKAEQQKSTAEQLARAQQNLPAWPTHVEQGAGIGHNLAAPALWALKALGEPFMAIPRLARGIPKGDEALAKLGQLYKAGAAKAGEVAAADPELTRSVGQTLGFGMPISDSPEMRAMKSRIEFEQSHSPEALAALAGPGLAPAFAPGGSAIFGERARQLAEKMGQPAAFAAQAAEQQAYSDPRASETAVQQFLREHLPGSVKGFPVGQLFDPQTQSVGEKLGEESGNPLLGMGLDMAAGIGPLAALGKVGKLARGVVGGLDDLFSISTRYPQAARVLGAEVSPLAHADSLIHKGYEAGQGMFGRWLEARKERLPSADAPTTTLPALPGEVPRRGPAPVVEPAAGAPEPPRPGLASPSVSPPAAPPKLDDVRASLDAAKREFGDLNIQSIDRALTDEEKARMIFLRSALPGLQKQLRQLTMEGVQYSGAAPELAGDVHSLMQSLTPQQLMQFAQRGAALTGKLGEERAHQQAFEEMLQGVPDGVQYSGTAPQFNSNPAPARPAPAPAPAAPPAQPAAPPRVGVAPSRNLLGEVKSVPEINRNIRETLGMVSRGETQEPGLFTRWARRLSSPSDTRISYGDGTLPGETGGAYHGKRDLIEVRRPADGDTTYHEMGHQIARHSGLIEQAPAQAMADLDKLGDPSTPDVPASKTGARSSWSPSMTGPKGEAYKRGEGFAEFLRIWMTHPDEAQRLAPEMSQHWENWLDSQGAVGKRMRQHQADVQARADADFGKRMDAQVMSETRRKQLEAKSSRDDLTTRFFDRFHPLRKLRDMASAVKEILPSSDFYRGATMLASKVKNETNREVESLRDIFEAVRKAPDPRKAEDELRRYLYARRAQELHDRGMRSGFDQADIDQALRQYGTPTHEDIAQRLYDFQDQQLQILHDSGILSDEAVAKIREQNKSYIPLQRHFELGAGELSNQKTGIAGASLKSSNPIKAIRGSEREILDPLVGIVANTYRNRLAAAKNDVLRQMLKLWDEHGEKVGHAIKGEVQAPLSFTPAHVSELLREPKLRGALQDLGVDVDHVTPVELESLIEMLPEGAIARPNQAMLDQGHIVAVRENGKTRYMQLSPEMHRAVTGIGSEFTQDPWSIFNNAAGSVLRAGATSLNWKFALRNAMRDSLVLPLVSRVGGKTNVPFFPFMDGLVTKLRAAQGDPEAAATVDRWRNSGGRQDFGAQYADRGHSEDALRAGLGVLPSRENAGVAAVKSLGGRAKAVLGAPSEISEDATRLGHYKAAEAYFRRKHPDWSPEDVHIAAAFEARDTLDFSRRGSAPAVRWARANIPFLGAGMEGTRRQLEALRENPARYLGAGAAYMSAPTILNQTGIPGLVPGNYDNPDYNQLRQSTKDNDMVVRNPAWDGKDPNTEFIKLPHEKGPSALFSQLPEWVMQAMKGDQAPTGTRAQQMVSGIAGDFLPAGVDPLHPSTWLNTLGEGVALPVEMIANYDSYRDKPIIPPYLERQHPDPSQQYDDRSSVLARILGEKLGVSPLMIDHALYGTTAGLGQTAINHLIDPTLSALTGTPEAPSRQTKDAQSLALEMSGTQVFPGQPESMARFDAQLAALQKQRDRFMAHPTSKREAVSRARQMTPADLDLLKRMEMSDKKIKKWQSGAKDPNITPERREQLMKQIREESSRYTPAPGGKP